jgi:hypothetical protein
MDQRGRLWRRPRRAWTWGLVLACACGLFKSPAWADDDLAGQRGFLLRSFTHWAEEEFSVPAEVELDAALRVRVQALAQALQTRAIATAMAAVKLQAGDSRAALEQRSTVNWLEAMVRWQIDRVDDADDARLLRALRDPGFCASREARTPFSRWVVMLSRMPAEDRDAALQAQATLLARWGMDRDDLPARPGVYWMSTARKALQGLRAPLRPAGEPPAPPVLVWTFQPSKNPRANHGERCALAAWQLQREALAGTSPRAQAELARFALAWDPAHDVVPPPSVPGDDYPAMASRMKVQGTLRVRGRTNALGKGLDEASIVERRIQVEGLDLPRAVAFETMLDEASLRRAAGVITTGVKAGELSSVEIIWKLP